MDAVVESQRIAFVIFLGLSSFICGLNLYLSFLRYPLFRLRGRTAEYRYVSGFPFIGTVMLVWTLFSQRTLHSHLPPWAVLIFIVIAALDTGGPHWFIASQVRYYRKKARELQLPGKDS
ncbi:MAG TPA: hypothetical protein VFN26_12925 [Candidatus Acidoferrum sp.]|nr:hypothetical protein [Candidatus Acidoferrum sp.]